MIALTTTWAAVGKGFYVRDKNGTTWRVKARSNNSAVLVNRAGQEVEISISDEASVTIMEPDEREAISVLEAQLGARTVAYRDDGQSLWRVSAFPKGGQGAAFWARSHLLIVHGIYAVSNARLEQLTKAHDESHADPDPNFVKPHQHPGG